MVLWLEGILLPKHGKDNFFFFFFGFGSSSLLGGNGSRGEI